MEYLDIYDEKENFLGKKERNIVHKDGLWHKTVHCWLYDLDGNIYFQIRKDKSKLYTTASGHVQVGETLEEAFRREIEEEIGYKVDYKKAKLIEVNKFIMDREEADESIFRDRAFANVYACVFEGNMVELNYQEEELNGVIKINAKEALDIIKKESGTIKGQKCYKEENIKTETVEVSFNDFLVNPGETAIQKYGKVLAFIINELK